LIDAKVKSDEVQPEEEELKFFEKDETDEEMIERQLPEEHRNAFTEY